MKIKIGILIILIAVIGFFVWQNTSQKSNGGDKFVLSVNSWVGFGPFWLAKEKGFFDELGINVDIQTMEDTGQRKIALAKGDIDGLGDTVDLLVLERDENVPAIAVMQIDMSNGADGILATENIKDISDLKGKKIAVLLKRTAVLVEDVSPLANPSWRRRGMLRFSWCARGAAVWPPPLPRFGELVRVSP